MSVLQDMISELGDTMEETDIKHFEAQVKKQMEAVHTLAKLADTGSGGSRAAASVLLHAWNSSLYPIHDIRTLSATYAEAALHVIQGIFGHGFLGGEEIENQLGRETIRRFAMDYSPR